MKKALHRARSEWLPNMRSALIALATYLVLFAMISAAITPERYDIRVGAPAPVTLRATQDVVDTVATDLLREQAAAQVDLSYKSVDKNVLGEVSAKIDEQFSLLLALSEGAEIDGDALSVSLSDDQRAKLTAVSRDALEGLFHRAEELARDALLSSLPEGHRSARIC